MKTHYENMFKCSSSTSSSGSGGGGGGGGGEDYCFHLVVEWNSQVYCLLQWSKPEGTLRILALSWIGCQLSTNPTGRVDLPSAEGNPTRSTIEKVLLLYSTMSQQGAIVEKKKNNDRLTVRIWSNRLSGILYYRSVSRSNSVCCRAYSPTTESLFSWVQIEEDAGDTPQYRIWQRVKKKSPFVPGAREFRIKRDRDGVGVHSRRRDEILIYASEGLFGAIT